MRPLVPAAAVALTAVLLACGGSDPAPLATEAVAGPQVFFLQVDT